jgi:p-aminobenzoyl-glutamate transporter AbgT
MANAVGAMTVCKSSTQYSALIANVSSTSAQDLGMVLFLAISGSLFHNVAVDKVGNALPGASEAEIGTLIAGTSNAAFNAFSDDDKTLVIPEIANAMKSIWAFFMAAAALSFVCACPLLVSIRPNSVYPWGA